MSYYKITKSYIPLTMRVIRSIFILFLSFMFNILFVDQTYYEKKFNDFNDKYKFIHDKDLDLTVSTGQKISFELENTLINAFA